ncbi:MAG: acyltransferase, partial [Actinomycetota bacterium]|nr:acyltransferase [Actinomycetota bacterium]
RVPVMSDQSDRSASRRVRRLAVVAWVGAALSGGLMIGLAKLGVGTERLYLGTDTRAAAIMLGAGLACSQWLVGGDRPVSALVRRLISVVGIGAAGVLAVAWAVLSGTGYVLYQGGLAICSVAATLILLDVITPGRSPLQRILAVAPLRWLGLISYGLYVWHWPIFQYLHPGRFGLSGWTLVAVQIAVSVAVAFVSYRLIEQPIRRGALTGIMARRSLTVGALAATVALLVGTTGAIDPGLGVAAAQGGYTPGSPSAPRIMTVGDSVSLSLTSDGIVTQARKLGVRVVDRAKIGCTIMRDEPDPTFPLLRDCSPGWPVDVRHFRPDVVVVLFGLWPGVIPFKIGASRYLACDPPWQHRWRQRLNAAIDTLSARGAKVVLVSAPTTDVYFVKGNDPALFDREQTCSNHVLAEVAQSRAEAAFVDLAHFVCPDDTTCKDKINGATLRPDAEHFRGAGAQVVAQWLIPRVLSAVGRRG